MSSQTDQNQRYLAIGYVAGVHGLHGEIKVEVLTDFPERFRPGEIMYLGNEDEARPVEIEAVRPHKQVLLVKLKSVPDRNAADLLRGQYLLILEAEAMPLATNENYAHDVVGLTAETNDGRVLGKITEILYTGSNDVYVVRGEKGELLIPALRDVVLEVDLTSGRMIVALPEGLES